MDRLLTVRELAERLGISPGTAYHWLSQGRLPCVRFSSRCVRFRESDVEKMLEQLAQATVRDLSSSKDKVS
jgi:excisionase family DNA binding protein